MILVSRGHEIMETSKIPAMMAPLILYISRIQVKIPPQKIPIHRVGLRILAHDGQVPSSNISLCLQPAIAIGVLVSPVMAPMPALYVKPIRALIVSQQTH